MKIIFQRHGRSYHNEDSDRDRQEYDNYDVVSYHITYDYDDGYHTNTEGYDDSYQVRLSMITII